MRILYLQNHRGYHLDVKDVMHSVGCVFDVVSIPEDDATLLDELLNNSGLLEKWKIFDYDCVFSLDYYPTLASICSKLRKIYISWVLEPPFSTVYSASVIYPTNRIFLADFYLAYTLQKEGISNIWYLSEGVNLERCRKVSAMHTEMEHMSCSIIANTRVRSWQELFKTENLLDASLGYMEGLVAAQNYVYGRDFFERSLPEYLHKDLANNSPLAQSADSVETLESFYAQQCFYPRTSAVDCSITAKILAKVAPTYLFSDELLEYPNLKCAINLPYESRLDVIRNSTIHVVVAPRGFKDGLYGQALQTMGMGGFLITDYRLALAEELKSNKICLYYEDMLDLATKVHQYTLKDAEREEIANNGKLYVEEYHDLRKKMLFIMSCI